MKAYTPVPFVDTNIIPDRNAGIGSLLLDLQTPADHDQNRPPLLGSAFAFTDVGVSRARASTALNTLLKRDLMMDVHYVATELAAAVPYAHVTLLGDRAETIRKHLSGMSPCKETRYAITDWHYVVDREGKVCSVAYSYALCGNEVWEAYFMGRTFVSSGEHVAFSDPALDKMLASDVRQIEARIEMERRRDNDSSKPNPSWDGYRMVKNPLEAGLAEHGIDLQCTDVPERINGRQNVLFLGNVLNHYPREAQARELDRIAANMEAGDLIIVQSDEIESPCIEVLYVEQQEFRKTRERVRWINTTKLEVQSRGDAPGSWRTICLQPMVARMASRLDELIGKRANALDVSRDNTILRRRHVALVFRSAFRALPVEVTLRIAVREALCRLHGEGDPQGASATMGDADAATGGELRSGQNSMMSEAMVSLLGLINQAAEESLA